MSTSSKFSIAELDENEFDNVIRSRVTGADTAAVSFSAMRQSMADLARSIDEQNTLLRSIIGHMETQTDNSGRVVELLSRMSLSPQNAPSYSTSPSSRRSTPMKGSIARVDIQYEYRGSMVRTRGDAAAVILNSILLIGYKSIVQESPDKAISQLPLTTTYDTLKRSISTFAKYPTEIELPSHNSPDMTGCLSALASPVGSFAPVVTVEVMRQLCEDVGRANCIRKCMSVALRFTSARGVICQVAAAIFTSLGAELQFTTSTPPQFIHTQLRVPNAIPSDLKDVFDQSTSTSILKYATYCLKGSTSEGINYLRQELQFKRDREVTRAEK
jgi:hypothetical protein